MTTDKNGAGEEAIMTSIAARFAEHPDISIEAARAFVAITWPTVVEKGPEGETRVFSIKPASHGAEATCALGADRRTNAHLPGGTEHAMFPVQACTVAVSLCAGVPIDAIYSGIFWHCSVPRGAELILKICPAGIKHGRNTWNIDVLLTDGTCVFKKRTVWTQIIA